MNNSSTIYPQKINGHYRRLKDIILSILLFIYFIGPWLRWDRGDDYPKQALLIDLPNRRGYFFGIEIWPDEAYYITGALILAALGLFLFTSLFGRLWCGYTCPHTVFVDLFVKIETLIQGDRNQRIRLANSSWDKEKCTKIALTHAAWLLLGFAFAAGWVSYFYDAPTLWRDLWHFNVGSATAAWLLGLTCTTYILGGFARQRVCIYMCPYGRFQSAMLDNDTAIVTYHDWRGEPRGKDNNAAQGDCIDCHKCVVVCPMGIDIRDGLQMACIGCGLCIDACNSVMTKIGKPLGLIDYDSANSTNAKKNRTISKKNIVRAKTIIFTSIFITVSGLMLNNLLHKQTITVSSMRGRNALFTLMSSGDIRNTYELKITNRTLIAQSLILRVDKLSGAKFKIQDLQDDYQTSFEFTLEANEEWQRTVFVQATPSPQGAAQQQLTFTLLDPHSGKTYTNASVFVFR